jgi:mRNA-degrading endonuclease RelE of RelBE toxin-antitoxin system
MDKIEKALNKLSSTERKRIKAVLQKIFKGEIKGLDIKKLKGRGDIFRVRKGNIRIIYRVNNGETHILKISRRNEQTYDL